MSGDRRQYTLGEFGGALFATGRTRARQSCRPEHRRNRCATSPAGGQVPRRRVRAGMAHDRANSAWRKRLGFGAARAGIPNYCKKSNCCMQAGE